jgi:hypothetical protein
LWLTHKKAGHLLGNSFKEKPITSPDVSTELSAGSQRVGQATFAETPLSAISRSIQPEQKMKTKNITTPHLGKSSDWQPLRCGLLLIAVVLACFGLSLGPKAFGVTPAPDGGYANENTAEGDSALFSLTTGDHNTANGFEALFSNTTGSGNTAIGHNTLQGNTTGFHNTATGGGALVTNTTGSENTASGRHSLSTNTTGNENTATGSSALFFQHNRQPKHC